MNEFVALLGIQSWKPFLTLLVLPPFPFFVLILAGAALLPRHKRTGWVLVTCSVVALYLSFCNGLAIAVNRWWIDPPPALEPARIAQLRAEQSAQHDVAIIVLGGGREALAPEYGLPNLTPFSAERLRYGVWLARRTGAPLGFSGGIGWSQPDAVSEAEVGARIAAEDYGLPMKWLDTRSRDTRENAEWTIKMLAPDGVRRVLLVTHGWHMPRALRDFRRAAEAAHVPIEFLAAPMGLALRADTPVYDWLPTSDGYMRTRAVLREALARLLKA